MVGGTWRRGGLVARRLWAGVDGESTEVAERVAGIASDSGGVGVDAPLARPWWHFYWAVRRVVSWVVMGWAPAARTRAMR